MGDRKITAELLEQHGACRDQVEKFRALWPNGVIPTSELADKYASEFDFDWAAHNLLSATAWAEYVRITASAWAEYQRIREPAWAAYERIRAAALAEYARLRATAWAEYERTIARAFVELWRGATDIG